MSQHDASSGDPHRLSGLAQAAFVLKCLAEGESTETIAEKLHGDELRVTIKSQEPVERLSQLSALLLQQK
jgi:hypothetical protein